MQLPQKQPVGLSTVGLAGITLMALHITGFLTGWAWPILYVFLILSGHGHEIGNGRGSADRSIK